MAKKIAFIDLMFRWPPSGGASLDIKEVASRLRKRGFDVKLFAPYFTEYLPRGVIEAKPSFPVETIPFNKFTFNFYHLPKKIKKQVDKFKPDFVYIADGYNLKPWVLSAFSGYNTFFRFYAYEILCITYNLINEKGENCNNSLFLDYRKCIRCKFQNNGVIKAFAKILMNKKTDPFYLLLSQEFIASLSFLSSYPERVRSILKKTNGIIVYNNYLKSLLAGINENIMVFPSGVDTKTFKPEQKIKNRKKVILMTGRTSYSPKGFSVLRNACKELLRKRDDFLLYFTADPEFEINNLEEKEKNNFIFIDWVPQSRLPLLYNNSVICVVPSTWREPFGITAIEAMACGKPVIASKIGGLEEIIEDGKNGFFIEPGNVRSLMQKLEILLENEDMRIRMGEEGRKKAEREYDWDKIIDNFYMPLFKNI